MTKRRFLLSVVALVLAAVWTVPSVSGGLAEAQAPAPLDPRMLTKYMDPLPDPSKLTGANLEIGMWQVSQKLHSQLANTTVWAYGVTKETATYPGATIEATRYVPTQVKWLNNLTDAAGNPLTHPLPVDQTLHWADPLGTGHSMLPYDGPIPTVVHLHGGEVEAKSDGHPEAWFTPGFVITGPAWQGNQVYTYANDQPAATLWYHDHALGITRLNVYMGLAGFYLLKDPGFESGLNLPSGAYEREIVIQDRSFNVDGSLAFPAVGVNPTVHPFWVPEFFGDTIVVNGKIWPYLNVEPRKYRFRLLNGSNARFYNLSLSNKQPFFQIGTDGGYLSAPVQINELLIAPGERADIVVDFSGLAVGTQILLTNDAKTPFPKGAPADPQTVSQIMQFRVVPLTGTDTSVIPATLNTIPTLTPGPVTRTLTLNEVMGPGGPLAMFLDGKMWDTAVTENVKLGSTEIWEVINLTADTHPIHLHLVQFQLLSRQRFQTNKYLKAYSAANPVIPIPIDPDTGEPLVTYNPVPVASYLQGKPVGPDPNEAGWKDTLRMNPGEVTRIIVRFAPFSAAVVTPYSFDATAEPGYVWHCHILDHEDNEMMRPYKVVAP